jgi:hypothetical protein
MHNRERKNSYLIRDIIWMKENDNMDDVVCDVCLDDRPEEEPSSG